MRNGAVPAWCQRVWDSRERGSLPDATVLSRGLHGAIGQDVVAGATYDPEEDALVEWAREVIKQRRRLRPQYKPMADANQEALAAWLLGREETREPCGKELAAGS